MRIRKIYLFLAFNIVFISCNKGIKGNINGGDDANQEPKSGKYAIEDFEGFYKRFNEDSLFQRSRIIFPLPGINTDDMDINQKKYYWEENKWIFKSTVGLDTINFKKVRKTEKTKVIEEITSSEYLGLIIRFEFSLVNGKWFLTRYEDVNL